MQSKNKKKALQLAEAEISEAMHAQEEDAHFFDFFFPLSLGDCTKFSIEKPSNEGLENLPSLGSEIEKIQAEVYAR
ncbi:uncharacterized protein DS421_11g335950 [Arachis hypogaea]|nr:uncharacterized protein DS421_11g335950 [Arachis hypogaea]